MEKRTSAKKTERREDGLPEGLPAHFFDTNGELDLRNVTGAEFQKYMMSMQNQTAYEE